MSKSKIVAKVYEPRPFDYPNPCVDFGFDPDKDVASVDQVGFVDLHKAFVTSTIPGDLVVDDTKFNEVGDPASLSHRPRDVFEAIRNAEGVRAAQSAAAAAEAAAASSAVTE